MNKKFVRQKILNYHIHPINTQTLKEVIIDWIKNKKKVMFVSLQFMEL